MQSEHAIRPADVDLLGNVDGPDADQRWQTWSARGARRDRETARTVNRGFVAIFAALSTWLVFQLLS